MRSSWIVVLLAACGSPGAATPHDLPSNVQLVRCIAAIPKPQAGATAESVSTERPVGAFGMAQPRRLVVGRRPTVSLGVPSVSGPVAADEIAVQVRGKLPDLTTCYATQAASLTRAAVQYRFVIAVDGSVSYVDATSGALGGTLDSCVRRALRALRFSAKRAATTVIVPLVFDATGTYRGAAPDAPPDDKPEPWTPYALGTTPSGPAATGAAKATEAVLRPRLPAIEQCFAKSKASGSLRMLLEIDLAGDLVGVPRAGGIGDRDAEACAAKALAGMKVMTPLQEHVEVACDLARGDAQPWRISTAGGYDVIDIERTQLRHASDTLAPGSGDPEPLPAETYLVVARPDTPGGLLQLALMWARDANAVILAVADGKPAPLFLGMGNATSSASDDEDADVMRPALRVGGKQAIGCIGKATHKANVTNGTEVSALLGKLAARCHQLRCSPTLVVSIDSDALARDLLEVAGAARRAGFDRVLFGGTELGCSAEVKKKPRDPDPEPDWE